MQATRGYCKEFALTLRDKLSDGFHQRRDMIPPFGFSRFYLLAWCGQQTIEGQG